MRIILGTAVALAIFIAGYFHIFDKSNDGYDNYAFAGDPVYFDYTDTKLETRHPQTSLLVL